MTTNEFAETLAFLTVALLLVMTAWGNAWVMFSGSMAALAALSVFLGIHGKRLNRKGLCSALMGCAAAAAIAIITLVARR
jgi:hypothetical protein